MTADSTEAFALLSDETRLAIIEELATTSDTPVSFSDLRERVGLRDSGQFSYHLEKLVGTFVEKGESGYRLTAAGVRVAGGVLSGHYGGSPDAFEEEYPDPCPACGTTVTVSYADGRLDIECENGHLFGNLVPPRLVAGRDIETVADLLAIVSVGDILQARFGACPQCFGEVTWSLRETSGGSPFGDPVTVVGDCDLCNVAYSGPPGVFLLLDLATDGELGGLDADLWDEPARWTVASQDSTVERYDLEAGTATATVHLADCTVVGTVDERGRALEYDVRRDGDGPDG